MTDAKAGEAKVKVIETSDTTWHGPISYVMAVVSASKNKPLSQAFVNFVASPEGRSVLARYGFLPAPSQ